MKWITNMKHRKKKKEKRDKFATALKTKNCLEIPDHLPLT